MNAQQLVIELKKEPEGIKELRERKSEIDSEIGDLETKRMYAVFEKITLSQLKTIWNKATHTDRYWILESNDYAEEILEKLDSHGGLRKDELMQEVIESKWNESQWIENLDECFESYCKGGLE